ncbi:hypothetical protein GGE67_000532 [Rhizobium leucaenae]|nr:hypothetical protein [Rhizobium leucaenae]
MISFSPVTTGSVGRPSPPRTGAKPRPANDNLHPRDIITVDQLAALRAAGWIVVRANAIRLAQSMAAEQARDDVREKYERECG